MHLDAAHQPSSPGFFPDIPENPDRIEASLIHALFERQVCANPGAIALSIGPQDWTYLDLDRAADRIAAAVAEYLPAGEAIVGVHVERSFEMLAALLGVMKAGAAYLPLDPRLPEAKLSQIIEDARPSLFLGDIEKLHPFAKFGLPLLSIDLAQRFADVADVIRRSLPIEAEQLAYVIYTSGSTGRPKGVEIRHAAVTNLIVSALREPGFGSHDVLLAATRMSFDVSVLDFFLPLSCGARIVMVDQDIAGDPQRLAKVIDTAKPTVMQATPATWRGLLEAGWQGSRGLRIWVGGEALSKDLAERLLPLCRELWNLYGPTETTIWSSVGRVRPGAREVSIGHPVANTSLHILDAAGLAVEGDRIGELCIGGRGLARGYRHRDDLTSQRFVDHPAHGRIYHTGDLARRGRDGSLYCLGRLDDQVKIRGYRVEMGEVETALSGHPDIAWSAVRCWPDAAGENALFGYVVARGDAAIAASALKLHLLALLPDYMVPQQILAMSSLPLTANGKVDRGALPHPRLFNPGRRSGHTDVALTSTELRLSAIWCELLELHEVLPNDDFFDLGGYSLLTIRLIRRIAEDFGRSPSTASLLSASTLKQMASLLERSEDGLDASALIPLQFHGDRPPLIWLDAGPLFRNVARAIGKEQPVLGLNLSPQQEKRLSESGFDVPMIAAEIAERLQAMCPTGPLYLGGWCRWGIVAYEVACQLRAQGRKIPLLLLLDTHNPANRRPALLRHAAQVWRELRGKPRPSPARLSFSQRVEAASRDYRPGPYDGKVALFEPEEGASAIAAHGGWQSVAKGPIKTFRSPGTHESMVRLPHARHLGAAIGAALIDAQTADA